VLTSSSEHEAIGLENPRNVLPKEAMRQRIHMDYTPSNHPSTIMCILPDGNKLPLQCVQLCHAKTELSRVPSHASSQTTTSAQTIQFASDPMQETTCIAHVNTTLAAKDDVYTLNSVEHTAFVRTWPCMPACT
jgi:hypothetical protein